MTEVDGDRAWTDRVIDPIDWLYRRRYISGHERDAAALFRHAWEDCQGSPGCSLVVNHIKGQPSMAPSERQMMAARRVTEAQRLLGEIDSRIVIAVACEGMTVREATAATLGGERASRSDSEHVGRRLREALKLLAELWVLGRQRQWGKARGQVAARGAVAPGVVEVDAGQVAHATQSKVFRKARKNKDP